MSTQLLTLDDYIHLGRDDRALLDTWLRDSGVDITTAQVDTIKCEAGKWSAQHLMVQAASDKPVSLRREWRQFTPTTPCPVALSKEHA